MFFALPLTPNALRPGLSFSQRVVVFLPTLGSSTPGEGHLYPDPYMYEFHKDEYDVVIEERIHEETSFFALLQDQHYRLIFGAGDFSFIDKVLNGTWLFLNTLPQLFVQEYVGGAFLWLFIIPGLIYVYREKRLLFWNLIGLWLSMEFLIRYVLHFGRTHLNDIGWELALFAGVGLMVSSEAFSRVVMPKKQWICSIVLAVLVAAQLIQADRKILAFHYSRSAVPMAYAANDLLDQLPANAVVAHPRKYTLFFFSDVRNENIHPDTIDFLEERGKLREPFDHYGITHIIGYEPEDIARIKKVLPAIQVVSLPAEAPKIPASPFMKYLLHLVR